MASRGCLVAPDKHGDDLPRETLAKMSEGPASLRHKYEIQIRPCTAVGVSHPQTLLKCPSIKRARRRQRGEAAAVGVAAFPQGVRREQQSLAPLPSPPGVTGISGMVRGWFLLFQGQHWLPRRAEAEQLSAGCKKFGLKPHRSSPWLRHAADARSYSPAWHTARAKRRAQPRGL